MVDRSAYSSSSSSLLSTIRSVLSASPPAVASPGSLRLHTLFSIPRQVKSLYPLAHIHPADLEYNRRASSIAALEEQIFITASWTPLSPDQPNGDGQHSDSNGTGGAPLLILAMELYLYTIPEMGSAVLYISKLDSSGYGPKAIASGLRAAVSKRVFGEYGVKFGNTLTATLSSAVTQHFTSFRHWDCSSTQISHLSVHILARSQRAYLFPSSPENKDKKVLSDGGLIKWWRAVMSNVVVSTRSASSAIRHADGANKDDRIDARAYYVIPGYTKMESHPLVPLVASSDPIVREAAWTYGHPYSSTGASCSASNLPPLPLHWRTSAFIVSHTDSTPKQAEQDPGAADYDPRRVRTVPTLMPHFSDDPKTRFLDEMARDAHEHAGWKKKSHETSKEATENGTKRPAPEEDKDKQDSQAQGSGSKRLKTETQAEAKAETAAVDSSSTSGSGLGVPLVTLRAMMRERAAMDDLAIDEFWERMGFRQECCSGNAIGVLVCLFTRLAGSNPPVASASATSVMFERQPLSLPYKVLGDLVFKSLMKDTCQWDKRPHAEALTEAWFQGVDREVKRKGGLAQVVGEEERAKEGLVGKGLIWDEFELKAPKEGEVEQVRKEMEEKRKLADRMDTAVAGGGVAAPVTNMLSVKRKKKPTA